MVNMQVKRIANASRISIRFIHNVVFWKIRGPAFNHSIHFVRNGCNLLFGEDVRYDHEAILLEFISHLAIIIKLSDLNSCCVQVSNIESNPVDKDTLPYNDYGSRRSRTLL